MAKIRRPKRFYNLDLRDEAGTKIELRLTTGAMDKLSDVTGKKFTEFLETMDDDIIRSFIQVLWASRQPFLSGDGKKAENRFTMEDAEDMYDDLIDNGYDIMSISEILKGILRESGLMPAETEEGDEPEEVEELDEETKND